MPTMDTELRAPNKLPDIFRTINGINFDIGPLDRLRDSDSKPDATQWKSGAGEREKAVNPDRKQFPRIILRDALGHELDTFTTLQEAIYRAKWNVKQSGQAKEPLEWRLPKAPPPARPDLTRTFPPLKHPPVQQNEAQTRSKWDHSRVLEFDVEDVGFVRESLQYLPYAPSLSFLRQEILVGPKTYFQIVGTMLLHKRFLSHTEKRQAIYNFPGFCTGCIRMGLCYGCERGTELHFHEDKPVKTGGGFTYFKKDRPENEIKSRNPINWKIHQPDKALKKLMEEYAGVELEGPIPDEIKRHLDKHGGRREKIVSNIPDFAKEMQEMADKENRRRDHTSSDFRVRYGEESDLEDDLEGKGQGHIDPSDVRISMNGEGQGDMEGGKGGYQGQQGYTDGSEMEQFGTGEGTWRNRDLTSDDENRDASYDRDGHRLPKYRRVESDEDNAGDEETDTEIPYGRRSRRKEKLYKAPPPFKLKKSPKRSIVSQSPFSTDRKYDLPKGKGLDIKKSDKPPTEFKEFRNVDVSWKEPKKFELKKGEQKTTKFWSGPPKKKKEKKKAETDEHEDGHGSRRVRSPAQRSPRSVSPDSGHDSEFQTVKTQTKISKRQSRKQRNKKRKNSFISEYTGSKTDGQTTNSREENMCNFKTKFPKINNILNPKSEGDSQTLNGFKKNKGNSVKKTTDNAFDDHKNIHGMKQNSITPNIVPKNKKNSREESQMPGGIKLDQENNDSPEEFYITDKDFKGSDENLRFLKLVDGKHKLMDARIVPLSDEHWGELDVDAHDISVNSPGKNKQTSWRNSGGTRQISDCEGQGQSTTDGNQSDADTAKNSSKRRKTFNNKNCSESKGQSQSLTDGNQSDADTTKNSSKRRKTASNKNCLENVNYSEIECKSDNFSYLSSNRSSLDGYHDTAAEYYKNFDIDEYQRRSRSQDLYQGKWTHHLHPRYKGVRKARVQRNRSPGAQNLVLYKPRSSTISPILYQGQSHDQNQDQSGLEDNLEDSEEDVKRLMEANITLSDLESNASTRRRLGNMSTRLQSRSIDPRNEENLLESSQATPFKGFRGHHTLVANGKPHKRGPVTKAIELNNRKTLEGSMKKKMETINLLPQIAGQKTDAESPLSHDPRQNKHKVISDPFQRGSLSTWNRVASGTNVSTQAPRSQTDTPSSIESSTRTAGMTVTPNSRSRSRSLVKEYQAIYQRQHSRRADSLPVILGQDKLRQNSLFRHRTINSSIQESVENHSERNGLFESHTPNNGRSDPRVLKVLERKAMDGLVPTEADDDLNDEVVQWNQQNFHKVPTGRRESFMSNAQSHFTVSYVDHNFSTDEHLENGIQGIDQVILEADQENEHASDEVNDLVEKSKENEHEKCNSYKISPPLISSDNENDKGSLTSQEPDLELVFDDVIDVANLEIVQYEETALDWDELKKKERRRKHKHRKHKKNRKEMDIGERNDGDTENMEEEMLQGDKTKTNKEKETSGLEEQDSIPTETVDGNSGIVKSKQSKRRKASVQSALSERDHSLEKNNKKGKQKTNKTKVMLETTEYESSDADDDDYVVEDIDNLNKRQHQKEKRKKRNRDVGRESSLNVKNDSSLDQKEKGSGDRKKGQQSRDRSKEKSKRTREDSSIDRKEEVSRDRKKGQKSRDRSKEVSKHNREDSSVGRKKKGSRDREKGQQRRERSKERCKCSRESSSVGTKEEGSRYKKRGQQSRDKSSKISKHNREDSSLSRNENVSRDRKKGERRNRSTENKTEDEFNKKDGRKTRSKERSGGERKLRKKNSHRGKGSVHKRKNEDVENNSDGEIDFNELPSIKSQLAKLFPNIRNTAKGAHGDSSNEEVGEMGETENENNENESSNESNTDTDADDLADFKHKKSRPKSDERKNLIEISGNAWNRVRSMSMPQLQDLEEFYKRMGIPSLEDLKNPIRVPVYLPSFKQGRVIIKKQFKSNPKRVKGRERRSMSLAVVTLRPLFDPEDTTIKSELEPVREETITVTPEPDMGLSERTGTPLQLRVTSPTARNNKSKSFKKGKSGKNKKVKFKIDTDMTDGTKNKRNNSTSDTEKLKDILAKTESDSMLPKKSMLHNDNMLLKRSKEDNLEGDTFGGFSGGIVNDGFDKDKAQPASVSPLPKKREIIKKEKKVKTPIPPPVLIQEQKAPTPVKEKTPSPLPVEEERPVSREISFDFIKEKSLPELPPIEIPELPEIVEKQSEYKGVKKERKLIEVTPEIPEPKKKLPPPPKVAPRIKTRTTKRSKVAEAPVTSQELQQLADPLDFLAKYCIINPDRLPYYERVFNGAVNIQTPRYSRDNVMSRGEMVHLPPAQLSDHELNMLRDLSVITHAQTPRREGMSVPEQYLEKLNYSIEFIKMKQMALHEHMHKVQVEKIKLMAQMARELDRDIVRVDYKTKKGKKKKEDEGENTDENSPKKKKKKKKSEEPDYDSMGAMSVPKNFRPQKASDITDEVIVSRMDDKMLKKVKKDPAVKQYTLEVSRDIEKLKNFDQRIAQIEDEKDLVGLYCMDYYFKEENNTAPPYEFRRQQSRLYQKLHPNPDIEMNMEEVETALQQINNKLLSEKEFQYIYFILDLPKREKINFRLFSIIAALSEKVTQMDPVIRKLINKVDYNALDIKMEKSKELFELLQDETLPLGNAPADILAVELTAGGLTPEHTNYVLSKFNREGRGFVDFLDFVTYIPLFIEIHKRIIEDPFNENLDI